MSKWTDQFVTVMILTKSWQLGLNLSDANAEKSLTNCWTCNCANGSSLADHCGTSYDLT